jgi:RNA polymerase sigma-70 factor (ECF subfamily)
MTEVSRDESVSPDLARLFQEYSSMVYRTARAVTGSPEDAEDVVQTIFLKLIRSENSGQLKKNPRAYLYRAAVNLSLDLLRARNRRPFTHEIDRLETPLSAPDAQFENDLHRRLSEALADLSPEAAHILVLRYVHNYSDAKISKLLGTSRGAIAVRLFRLRARLKKALTAGRKP